MKKSRGQSLYIVCTHLSAGGFEPTKFSKRGLDRNSVLEEGWWERRGGDLFQGGGCYFYIKNKLKSELFKGCVHYIFVSLSLSQK